MLSFENLIN